MHRYYEQEEKLRRKQRSPGWSRTAYAFVSLGLVTAFIPAAFILGGSIKILRAVRKRIKI